MKKLLIVDDDLYIRDLYQEIFTDEGYEVETAVDGVDGLTKLQKGGYDLVLLDMMMPKLDGIGLLAKLKTNPSQTPNGKIILLTNLAHDPVIQEAIANGATAYLIKADLTPDVLVEKVKEYLQ